MRDGNLLKRPSEPIATLLATRKIHLDTKLSKCADNRNFKDYKNRDVHLPIWANRSQNHKAAQKGHFIEAVLLSKPSNR